MQLIICFVFTLIYRIECKTNRTWRISSFQQQLVTFSSSLLTPGRIDRKIEFPLPDEKTKRRIFQIHTSRMTLADDVTLDDLILAKDDLSGADIKVRLCLVIVKAAEGLH